MLSVCVVFVSRRKLLTRVAGSKLMCGGSRLRVSGRDVLVAHGAYKLAALCGVSGSLKVYVKLERSERECEWFLSIPSAALFKCFF